MALATLLILTALTGAERHPCPVPAQILRQLGVEGPGWTTTCHTGADGRWLLAGLRPSKESSEPELAVAVGSSREPLRRALFVLRGTEAAALKSAFLDAETWQIFVSVYPVKATSLLRVDVLGSSGEDLYVGQEIVTFIRMDKEALIPLWTGLGARIERRFDSCLLESETKFTVLPGGLLERWMTTKRTFRNAGVGRSLAAQLKKECVAPRPQREIFSLRRTSVAAQPRGREAVTFQKAGGQ